MARNLRHRNWRYCAVPEKKPMKLDPNDPILRLGKMLDADPIARQALKEAMEKTSKNLAPASPQSVQALAAKFSK